LREHSEEGATVSATLKLVREGLGVELWRGWFGVTVDGKSLGSLEYLETIEAPVEPGHHTLRVQRGRYSSFAHSFDASDGETVTFRCYGAMVWTRFVASLVKPDLAISLHRE
jgi:hypothetical protein